VRYTNPVSGGDVLPTIRAEMHRVRSGARPLPDVRPGRRCTRCSMAADGHGRRPAVDGEPRDLFVVPSWGVVRRPIHSVDVRLRLRPTRSVPVRRRTHLRGAARPPPRGHRAI